MHRRVIAIVMIVQFVFLTTESRSAEVVGRRQTLNGERPHATFLWYVGLGANPPDACIIGWTGGGDYRILELPGGRYWMAANEHGWYPHYFHDVPVTVPDSGTLRLDIPDRMTYDLPGFADLGNVMTTAQTFVATGTDVAVGMVLSASSGAKVRVTIREGGPEGPQIGPARSVEHHPLSPPIFRWRPGEVPLIPGRVYAVRQDSEDGKPFRPCIAYQIDPYPNGQAWLDGVWRPEADLRVAVNCRDDGLVDEYRVDNGYRRQAYQEVVQTFVPAGQELRLAQMMLAGAHQSYTMRVSVHRWTGSFPLGPQVGLAKHARMMADFFQGALWGPGELPLVAGEAYAIRYVRADGGKFSVYGDSDGYAMGKAYFDGTADESDDLAGRMIIRKADKGDIRLSDVAFEAVSSTEVRVKFKTDVPTTATVGYRNGDPLFESIVPADAVPKTSHGISVRPLRRGTPYDMRIWAYHPQRNILRSASTKVTTRGTLVPLKGRVHGESGAVAGAMVTTEGAVFPARTDPTGAFTLPFVPTGPQTLRVQTATGPAAMRELMVVPGDNEAIDVTLPTVNNLIDGDGKNLMAGWTRFGDFDGQWKNDQFKVPEHAGNGWIGSIASGVGGKKGGVHRSVPTTAGTRYRFGGSVLTDASEPNEGRLGGLAVARLGVDPTGGTDPKSPNVIWARYRCTGNTWKDLSVSFTAGGTKATLFAQHKFEDYYVRAPWWLAGFSDLYLVEERQTPTTNE